MKKLAKIPLYVLGAGAAAFVGTFTMYMFNLDMKLITECGTTHEATSGMSS